MPIINSSCFNSTILIKYHCKITHMFKSSKKNSEVVFQSMKCANASLFFGRYPTTINLGCSINSYQLQKCSRYHGVSKLYSVQNDTIPLTLASIIVVKLQYIMNATQLDCVLVACTCPFMRIERQKSGTNIYKGYAVNFLQDLILFCV